MPNLKIEVTISGKWKLDGQKIKQILKGAICSGVAAGGIWLVTHWPAPLISDIRPPIEAPQCRPVPPTTGTWCLEASPRSDANQQ